jgi:hypothetical protein
LAANVSRCNFYIFSCVQVFIKTLKLFPLWVFSPAFGLIRLPCPSVLSCDSKRTDKVSDSKLCRNATYVNGVCWLDSGPNRFMMPPTGLSITAIWTCFKSVTYKYVSSFVMLWNSYALLADRLQIVEFELKYLNDTECQVHSACYKTYPRYKYTYLSVHLHTRHGTMVLNRCNIGCNLRCYYISRRFLIIDYR